MGSRTGHAEGFGTPSARQRRSGLREAAESLLVLAICVLFARTFVVQQSEIPSGSMEDTILVGDYILINRFLYAPTSFAWEREWLPIRPIARGDIVVFRHPPAPETDFVKRVVGLPGDRVELLHGSLRVNGRRVEEPQINPLYLDQVSYGPMEVEPGRYFVLGDHRNNSQDSRAWGTVPHELIKGRAFMTLFSIDAPPRPGEVPGRVTLRSILRKLVALVTDARWDRALRTLR